MKKQLSLALVLLALGGCSNLDTGYHTRNSSTAPMVGPLIDFNPESCVQSPVASVVVKTEKENFTFEAKCSARLYQTFLVENKVQCVVESSMCTEIKGPGMIEVRCKNGESHNVSFPCPAKN